jgi:hypothetical protein
MEIKYDLNVDDILALNLFRLAHVPSLHKRQIWMRWGYLVVTLLIVAAAYFFGVSTSMVFMLAVISVIFFIFFPKNEEWQIKRMVNKIYKDPSKAETLLGRTMILSKKQLETVTSSGHYEFPWTDLDVVSIDDKRTVMSFDDGTCLVVPRERLAPGSDYEAFTGELRSHIGQANKER